MAGANVKECPDCGTPTSRQRRYCPQCGYDYAAALGLPVIPPSEHPLLRTPATEVGDDRRWSERLVEGPFGLFLIPVGTLLCFTLIGAIVGIPMIVLGLSAHGNSQDPHLFSRGTGDPD